MSLAGERGSLELAAQQELGGRSYVYERPVDSGCWDLVHMLRSVPTSWISTDAPPATPLLGNGIVTG